MDICVDDKDKSLEYVKLQESLEPNEWITININYETDIPNGEYSCSWITYEMEPCEHKTYTLKQFCPIIKECEMSTDYNINIAVPHGYLAVSNEAEGVLTTSQTMDIWRITGNDIRNINLMVGDEFPVE